MSLRVELEHLRTERARKDRLRILHYLNWASHAVFALSKQISAADIEQLVLTRRYDALLSGSANFTSSPAEGVLQGLLEIEVEQRCTEFREASEALERHIKRWSIQGTFVVLDTSMYIHHDQKLEDLDFVSRLNRGHEQVHILVPIAVVDELDSLKQSKNPNVRWRARYTLAVLDRLLKDPTEQTWIRTRDSGEASPSELTIELVFDPPRHIRLPITDDEIIDRALAVQTLAARPITLFTYDTGQSTRARSAGLQVVKLSNPIGDEPK